MGSILRICACGGKVEESQQTFVSAIRYFKKYGAVSAIQFLRFDDVEVGREFHFPGSVLRRFVDVRDDLVRVVARIDSEVNLARELFVRPHGAERFGLEKIGARLDFDAQNFCAAWNRKQTSHKYEQQTSEHGGGLLK